MVELLKIFFLNLVMACPCIQFNKLLTIFIWKFWSFGKPLQPLILQTTVIEFFCTISERLMPLTAKINRINSRLFSVKAVNKIGIVS